MKTKLVRVHFGLLPPPRCSRRVWFKGRFKGRFKGGTFGLSGCRVKPRRLSGRWSFTRQPENSKRAHFRAPALQAPPKFHEKTSKRERRRTKMRAGEKKSAKFWAPHTSGPTPGPHPFWGTPSGTPPLPGLHSSGPNFF